MKPPYFHKQGGDYLNMSIIQLLFVYTSLCIYELSERENFVSHILADGTDLNVNIQLSKIIPIFTDGVVISNTKNIRSPQRRNPL